MRASIILIKKKIIFINHKKHLVFFYFILPKKLCLAKLEFSRLYSDPDPLRSLRSVRSFWYWILPIERLTTVFLTNIVKNGNHSFVRNSNQNYTKRNEQIPSKGKSGATSSVSFFLCFNKFQTENAMRAFQTGETVLVNMKFLNPCNCWLTNQNREFDIA
jgi:hypothetical protein